MRKILYAAGVLVCAGMLCAVHIVLAQDEKAPVQEVKASALDMKTPVQTDKTPAQDEHALPPDAEAKEFVGTIDVIIPADAMNKTPGEVKVIDEKGTRLIFTVKLGTPIMGREGKLISLGRLKKDDLVVLKYRVDVQKRRMVTSIVVTE